MTLWDSAPIRGGQGAEKTLARGDRSPRRSLRLCPAGIRQTNPRLRRQSVINALRSIHGQQSPGYWKINRNTSAILQETVRRHSCSRHRHRLAALASFANAPAIELSALNSRLSTKLVPGTGLEPAHLTVKASKTFVSAIPPPGRVIPNPACRFQLRGGKRVIRLPLAGAPACP
jgi:hypothetical protein